MTNLLKIAGASAFIPGERQRRLILKNINLELNAGIHTAILGPNGAGKSSLLRLMAGELRPCAGMVAWFYAGRWEQSAITGRQMTALLSPQMQAQCQIQRWQVSGADLLAQGESGASLATFASADITGEARELAAELGILPLLAMSLPQFSQGQLRLLLLLRALLASPRLLLLDEWAEGLDADKRRAALALLQAKSRQMTMIFTSHRECDLPPWVEVARYLNEGALLPAGAQPANVPAPPAAPQPVAQSGDRVTLALKNASVYVDRELVLKKINWQLRAGEHWRIAGNNGAGKSTFLRLLAGDEFVAAGGSLRYWPRTARACSALADRRKLIALVSDRGQAEYGYGVSALQLLLSGLDNTIGLWRECAEAELQRGHLLLAQFFPHIANIAEQSIRRLSSGQLRALFLARALMTAPEILLLDEPFSGLDGAARANWQNLLARLANGEAGLEPPQIIMVTHYEEDEPGFINRRARLEGGELFVE